MSAVISFGLGVISWVAALPFYLIAVFIVPIYSSKGAWSKIKVAMTINDFNRDAAKQHGADQAQQWQCNIRMRDNPLHLLHSFSFRRGQLR